MVQSRQRVREPRLLRVCVNMQEKVHLLEHVGQVTPRVHKARRHLLTRTTGVGFHCCLDTTTHTVWLHWILKDACCGTVLAHQQEVKDGRSS